MSNKGSQSVRGMGRRVWTAFLSFFSPSRFLFFSSPFPFLPSFPVSFCPLPLLPFPSPFIFPSSSLSLSLLSPPQVSGQDIAGLMRVWTTRMGYPYLTVSTILGVHVHYMMILLYGVTKINTHFNPLFHLTVEHNVPSHISTSQKHHIPLISVHHLKSPIGSYYRVL